MGQDEEIKAVRDLVRRQSDVAGWLVIGGSSIAMLLGKLEPLPDGLTFLCVGLVVLLGSGFMAGMTISKMGISISEEEEGES